MLPQILPHFPKNINTFVDLFCGGANVGCNVDCKQVIFNDIDKQIVNLLKTFKDNKKEKIFEALRTCINKYKLSWVSENGYSFYHCESGKGVGAFNKEQFLHLRDDFNKINPPYSFRYYIMLYVLIIFSFNNQVRFNEKGKYNLPVGKRDFNIRMQGKLNDFIDRLHSITCTFTHIPFHRFDITALNESDFVYCDPPYLITCATYNENGLWNKANEVDLLNKLDELNGANIRFALSNVLKNKGKENTILSEWLQRKPQYRCIHLDFHYGNSNYQTKDKKSKPEEVLIVNY